MVHCMFSSVQYSVVLCSAVELVIMMDKEGGLIMVICLLNGHGVWPHGPVYGIRFTLNAAHFILYIAYIQHDIAHIIKQQWFGLYVVCVNISKYESNDKIKY